MNYGALSDGILDYVSQSEFDGLVCEPGFEEEKKQFMVCEDLSALDEFGY